MLPPTWASTRPSPIGEILGHNSLIQAAHSCAATLEAAATIPGTICAGSSGPQSCKALWAAWLVSCRLAIIIDIKQKQRLGNGVSKGTASIETYRYHTISRKRERNRSLRIKIGNLRPQLDISTTVGGWAVRSDTSDRQIYYICRPVRREVIGRRRRGRSSKRPKFKPD